MVIAQIESIKAMDSLDDIFQVDGLDGFMVGPYDLSCSMNLSGEFQSKDYKDALNRILLSGKENNCLAGIHIVEPNENEIKQAIENNFKMIAYSVDFKIINETITNGIQTFRNLKK